ncbi:hypothetical protein BBJ28_00022472 [Nothophytophthora sp. Chile5]|nr:hypothetical protein BBJ28_00022472 [Nothophytophthora sp. Chile5]
MKIYAVLALALAYVAALAAAADPPTDAGVVNEAISMEGGGAHVEAVTTESTEYSHNNWGDGRGNNWHDHGGYGGGGGHDSYRELDEAVKAEAAEYSHGWNGNGNRNWDGHGGGGNGHHGGMKSAVIAVLLACMAAFVVAAEPASAISTAAYESDRVAIAQHLENMMLADMEANKDAAAMQEDLWGFLSNVAGAATRVISNPAVLSRAVGLVTAAASGDKAALARNALGLAGAVLPPGIIPTPPAELPVAAPAPELPSAAGTTGVSA